MAEKAPDPGEPIDVRKIHYLVRLMKRYDLTDLNISDGQVQIRLKRRGPESAPSGVNMAGGQQVVPAGPHAYSATPPPAAGTVPRPGPYSAAPPPAPQAVLIKSPMVGTYYASSAPDAPPFVGVGSVVQPDSTVCIIEAMTVFTDIPAGVSGTIAEVLVKNGQPVEFDQPLFRVIPS